MSDRRRLRAGTAPVVTPGELPVFLAAFRVVDWLDDGGDDDWRWVRARRAWSDARDRWLLDRGEYRGRWRRERQDWERIGWGELEARDPVLAARLRVPDSYDQEVVP